MDKIIERIERESGVAGLASILAERLSPTDLQSLLLEAYRVRAGRRRPSDVLASYESDRFVRPSAVSPRRLLLWDQTILSSLPKYFEPVALSPICPLGTCSAVATIDQNWAVATARNTEVVSDSTNVMALECAVRRRELLRSHPKSTDAVHLAASHRLLRAQRYDKPGFTSHFNAFALCSAGRDQGNSRFELISLGTHLRIYLQSLRTFLGPELPLKVAVTDFTNTRNDQLEAELLTPLRAEFGGLDCMIDSQRTRGRGYYNDFCFLLHAIDRSGQSVELADGGSVDWTRCLLSNAKERLVISGIGSERLCSLFVGE